MYEKAFLIEASQATRLESQFVTRRWLFAGPAGQIAVPLLAPRIGPPVVMIDARCKNALRRRLPSRPRQRDASRAKHECRNQRGREITNHAKLLIVSVSERSCHQARPPSEEHSVTI